MKKAVSGFTIVELLIVIVVIAILATISVAAYNGIQNRSYDSAVESDLRNLVVKIRMFHALNGHYPTTASELAAVDMKATKTAYDLTILGTGTTTLHHNLLYCWTPATDPQKFAFIAASKSGNAFEAGSETSVKGFPPISVMDSAVLCPASAIGVLSGRTYFYESNAWKSYIQ